MTKDEEQVNRDTSAMETSDDDFLVHVPDPALGPLGKLKPPSLHLNWDPVPDLVAERDRYR